MDVIMASILMDVSKSSDLVRAFSFPASRSAMHHLCPVFTALSERHTSTVVDVGV